MASYTHTKDGKIKAPSWYKNSDGSTPSSMQKGLTKEKWESQNAATKQKKEAEAKKVKAKEKASAYLRDHPNAGQGGARDAGYEKILKKGGLNNATYQKMVNVDRKQQYEQGKADRKQSAEAYRQSRVDLKAMREQTRSTAERRVDQSSHYKHLMDTKGNYGGNKAHAAAVKQLMSTGQKFSNLDVQREMGSASTHNMGGLYKSYGGYENYFDNHSVGSGNFRGDESLGTMKEADDAQRQYFTDRTNYFNSDSFNEKYGKYDWAQRSRNRMNEQATKFNRSFDARERRMKKRGYGSVYGY